MAKKKASCVLGVNVISKLNYTIGIARITTGMGKVAFYLDCFLWFCAFLVGLTSAAPWPEEDGRWRTFGYGELALCAVRALLCLGV
jgi:hypothetical protein